MSRVFLFNGTEYPDPDPDMTVQEVKSHLAEFMPELNNATVEERGQGLETVYEFKVRVGTKGASEEAPSVTRLLDQLDTHRPLLLQMIEEAQGHGDQLYEELDQDRLIEASAEIDDLCKSGRFIASLINSAIG